MPSPIQVARRWLLRVAKSRNDDVIYIGVFLDPMDAKRLLRTFGQTHPERYAHHLTLWHLLDGTDLPANLPWGKSVPLKVIDHVEDDRVQAVVVEPPPRFRPSGGRVPHVTLSAQPGVGPKASNDLLASWIPEQRGAGLPIIRGRLGWADSGGRVRFHPPA